MPKQIECLLSFIVTLLLGASLGYLAIIGLDLEIEQNNRDLESFRSQGYPINLPLPSGEVIIEQSAHSLTITVQPTK